MPTENLEKLVQAARDKKPTAFKQHLHAEIGTRAEKGIAEIRADLAKNMFVSKPEEIQEHHCNEEGEGVEHTHDDGTTHTHEGGDKPHTHDEEVEEGKLPPALQKAIDAKNKNNSISDDVDKTPAKESYDDEEDEDEDPVGEDTDKSEPGTQGDDKEYAKKRDAVLKKFGVTSCAMIKDEKEKKACFKALDDAHVADHEE